VTNGDGARVSSNFGGVSFKGDPNCPAALSKLKRGLSPPKAGVAALEGVPTDDAGLPVRTELFFCAMARAKRSWRRSLAFAVEGLLERPSRLLSTVLDKEHSNTHCLSVPLTHAEARQTNQPADQAGLVLSRPSSHFWRIGPVRQRGSCLALTRRPPRLAGEKIPSRKTSSREAETMPCFHDYIHEARESRGPCFASLIYPEQGAARTMGEGTQYDGS
jgi:hypothetical protein